MQDAARQLRDTLSAHGASLTRPRLELFQALYRKEAVSAATLLKTLKQDRSTAYRTIHLFEKTGIVRRVTMGWKYKLELSDRFSSHHHHLTCMKCHRVERLPEHIGIEQTIRTLAARAGYRLHDHHLELTGVCDRCQKK